MGIIVDIYFNREKAIVYGIFHLINIWERLVETFDQSTSEEIMQLILQIVTQMIFRIFCYAKYCTGIVIFLVCTASKIIAMDGAEISADIPLYRNCIHPDRDHIFAKELAKYSKEDLNCAYTLAKKYPKLVTYEPYKNWDLDSILALIAEIRKDTKDDLPPDELNKKIHALSEMVCAVVHNDIDWVRKFEPDFRVYYFYQEYLRKYGLKDGLLIWNLAKTYPALVTERVSSSFFRDLAPLTHEQRVRACKLANKYQDILEKFGFIHIVLRLSHPIYDNNNLLCSKLVDLPDDQAEAVIDQAATVLRRLQHRLENNPRKLTPEEMDILHRNNFSGLLTQAFKNKRP
jgi:hypothetical protein